MPWQEIHGWELLWKAAAAHWPIDQGESFEWQGGQDPSAAGEAELWLFRGRSKPFLLFLSGFPKLSSQEQCDCWVWSGVGASRMQDILNRNDIPNPEALLGGKLGVFLLGMHGMHTWHTFIMTSSFISFLFPSCSQNSRVLELPICHMCHMSIMSIDQGRAWTGTQVIMWRWQRLLAQAIGSFGFREIKRTLLLKEDHSHGELDVSTHL